jgi:octaprenyl-diphosphate synthase
LDRKLTSLNKISELIKEDIKSFKIEFNHALKSDVNLIQTVSRFLIKQKGKRIRPILTMLASRVCGEPDKSTYRAAAMIELLHIATLIHDDVVDGAIKRRRIFALNRIWGNKLSVLMGDYVLSKSLAYMIKLRDFDILELISKTAEFMSSGEIIQLDYRFKRHPTEEIYFKLIHQKTASLIAAACEVGALTTSKSKQDCISMNSFGYNLGIAYQMKDDLFDLCGNEFSMGKDKGIDVKKNNLTLPVIYSFQSLPSKERKKLLSLVKLKEKSNEILHEIKYLVKIGRGFQYTEEQINRFTHLAIDSLSAFPDSKYKTAMINIAQFNQTRIH